MIEALVGLDEEDDELKFDFENDLEEGEFLPEDWQEWKPEDEVVFDEDDYVAEHYVHKQPVTDTYITSNQSPIDFGVFTSALNDESDSDVSQMPSDRELTREEKRKWWFKREDERAETAIKKRVKLPEARDLSGGILSWFFDRELQLFVLKRRDGLQYLKRRLKIFSTLPKCEVKELAWKDLINIGDDPYAYIVEKIIRKEGRSGKFERLKPRKGKRFEDPTRIDPQTGKAWTRIIYKPVRCLKRVPLKTMPLDVLSNMKWWYVDNETAEAVMEDEDEQVLLRVYDPLHLVNLSQGDLQKLHEQPIFCHEGWKSEGRKYQIVVKVCIDQGLYAGSMLNRSRVVDQNN